LCLGDEERLAYEQISKENVEALVWEESRWGKDIHGMPWARLERHSLSSDQEMNSSMGWKK